MSEQPFDLNALLAQAMEMQEQLSAAQDEIAHTVVEGQAGGGAVVVEVTGGFEFRSVRIRPEAVDPDDVELLQDLVLAALRDAVGRIGALQAASVGGLGAALGAAGGLDGLLGFGGGDVIDVEGVDEVGDEHDESGAGGDPGGDDAPTGAAGAAEAGTDDAR